MNYVYGEGGQVQTKKKLFGGGMDIFWNNNILSQTKSNEFLINRCQKKSGLSK